MAYIDPRRTELRFLLATLLVAGLIAFLVFEPFIYYIALGVLLVFAFFPVNRRLRKWTRSPTLAAFLCLVLVIVIIVGPLVLVGFMVFNDAREFAGRYHGSELNMTVQSALDRFGIHGHEVADGDGTRTVPSATANYTAGRLQAFAEAVGREFVRILPHLALGLFIAGFVLFYGFLEGDTFYRQLRHTLPLPEPVEDSLFRQVRDVTKAVFVGTIFVSVLTSILGTITFLLFDVPNALFWGLIMVIFGILPILGPPFVYVPVGLWKLLEGDTVAGVAILVINLLVGTVYIERILGPRFIGKLGRIHPIWVLVGVLGGLEVFGVLGFVLGPLALAIFIALVRSYTEFHPRWVERARRGQEPFHPEGVLRPQPFEEEPHASPPAHPPPMEPVDPSRKDGP